MVDLDVAAYCLRLGDDSLVLAQRLCEWAARSPQLEEDVALMNLALDLLGQSRSLLTLAGSPRGRGARRGRPGLPARRGRTSSTLS
jgi:ring-1,2-phenylacetyl-CoA epoxidase subunit PaaC